MTTSVRRNEPIREWRTGDSVAGFAFVARREARRDRYGQEYLDLELTDASGSINAKAWPDSPVLASRFDAHDFVAIEGVVKSFKGELQLSLNACRRTQDSDRESGFDEADLVPASTEDIERLTERLGAIYPGALERPALRQLVERALDQHGAALREHPAAKVIHHAYLGGLLEHTVSMAELALAVAGHYPKLDRDLLLVGILFHDLGKLVEIGAMPANDYTVPGVLIGHVVIGRDMLREAARGVEELDKELLLHLEHLVLSHSGRREYGSPVEPSTPEAIALHAIDDLDAKLNQVEAVRRFGGLQFVRGLGRKVWVGAEGEEGEATGDDVDDVDDGPDKDGESARA